MYSQWAALATFAVAMLATVAKPLAPPTTGWLYTAEQGLLVFPLTAAQCEPFYIFYNTMTGFSLHLNDTKGDIVLSFGIPAGIGYVEWICNIPAGLTFVSLQFNYLVQAGSSSDCLGDLNTTYSLLTYSTTEFASFTQPPPPPSIVFTRAPTPSPTLTRTLPTTSFPTGAFATITLNPNLAVVLTTTSTTSSSSSSTTSMSSPLPPPSPPPTPSPNPNSGPVAGGVVGAVAFILLIVALVLWWRRRRSVLARASSPIDPQPSSISGLATSELEPTDPSSPFRFSGRFSRAEFLGGTQPDEFDPYSLGTEPTSDNLIVVPVTGNPAALVDPIVGQRPSKGIITPFDAKPALTSQRPRKPWSNGSQASHPGLSSDLPSRTPPTVEQQPPYTQSFNTPSDAAPETSRLDAMPLSQQPSTRETQEGPLGFTDVLGVISRAQLSETERLATVRNLLVSDSSGRPDLARQDTVSSPPPYTE